MLELIVIWVLVSIPAALLIGRFIAVGDRKTKPWGKRRRKPWGERRRITMRCLMCSAYALPDGMEPVRTIRARHEGEHPGHKMLLEIWH